MIHLGLAVILKVSSQIGSLLFLLLLSIVSLSILMMIHYLILILLNSLFYRVPSIYQFLNSMPNFSIKYSFLKDSVILQKTAIVRASSVDAAHDKLVRFLTRSGEIVIDDFKIVKTSVSSYNLVLS